MTSDTIHTPTVPDEPDVRQRAVIYCRVSTDDKGQTNKTQERECRRWCELQGYQVLDVYRDEATGTNLNRVGYAMMQNRIINDQDVDFVVAWDQSRITRSDNIEQIRKTFAAHRCYIRFVADSAGNDDTIGGGIYRDIKSRLNEEENEVRKIKTKMGMETRVRDGIHVGCPASFMFLDDIDTCPKGRFVKGKTKTMSAKQFFDCARDGWTIHEVAREILGIDPRVLIFESKPRDANDPKSRAKGVVDRYTPYMQLYNASERGRKGSIAQRVGNPEEIVAQRVVE